MIEHCSKNSRAIVTAICAAGSATRKPSYAHSAARLLPVKGSKLSWFHLVEITAYSDDDAYTIFETMNDRGLSLSPTDMLYCYKHATTTENKRNAANASWRERIRELNDAGKEVEA